MKRFLVFLSALVLAVTQAHADTDEKTLSGIVANLHENFAAATVEDLPRLMATMSAEMPNREAFAEECRRTWRDEDLYYRLEDVKLLKQSNAPYARTKPPYATVVVTQTILKMSSKDDGEFRNVCENGRCKAENMAHLMSLSTSHETTRLQMLFKKERGKWKLVAGLTNPEPVTHEQLQAEAEEREARPRRVPGQRSAF